MKNKFKFLTKESIKKKVNSKAFKIINILLLIIIPCLINLDSIVKSFGGDFNENINIYVVDECNIYDELSKTFNDSYLSILDSYSATVNKSDKTIDELTSEMNKDKSSDIIINIVKDKDNIFDAEIISYEYVDTVLYQNIANALNTTKYNEALLDSKIDQSTLDKIYKEVDVKRTILNEDLNENEELINAIGGVIVIIFIVPFFLLIILIIQMIGAEINEEKTSKSMEIIISSVSPKIHFMSKLVSANVFAITQGLLLIIYAVIGICIRAFTMGSLSLPTEGLGNVSSYVNVFLHSDLLSSLLMGIPFFIILMLLSFLAYSLFIGILASMTTSMEDYQQVQTPIMIFLMIGYYLAIYASVYQGSTFIKVAGYIPFISGILAPVLYTLGEMTILDLCTAISLLGVVCVLLYKYGLRIYKVGILNYSSSKLWKKMFKSLKEK